MFPYYLSYGMSTDEYWNQSPLFVKAYRKKHWLDIETRNQELWMQGLYIYNAFGTVMANAFGKKGAKREKYLEKPIEIVPKTGKELKAEQERERQKLIKMLNAWEKRWKSTHEDVN